MTQDTAEDREILPKLDKTNLAIIDEGIGLLRAKL